MFIGIIIDIGASRKSTAGYGQFQALQTADSSVKLNTSIKGQVNIQFRIGTISLIKTVYINSLIDKIQFHVIQANTLFLLCLADMDKLQMYYNNLKNVLIIYTKKMPVIQQFSHPFLLWNIFL